MEFRKGLAALKAGLAAGAVIPDDPWNVLLRPVTRKPPTPSTAQFAGPPLIQLSLVVRALGFDSVFGQLFEAFRQGLGIRLFHRRLRARTWGDLPSHTNGLR